jgi:hypothetical protein
MSEPGTTEGELFAKASEYLDLFDEDESIDVADASARRNTPVILWRATSVGMMTQYTIGDTSAPVSMRLVNRPLQERYNSGGFGDSHVSYLLGAGANLLEHEVYADGFCWLRAILMQYQGSLHQSKRWDSDTGDTKVRERTGSWATKKASTTRGAEILIPLNREITIVVDKLAEFIANNPVYFQEAVDKLNSVDNARDWEPFEQGRAQYEYGQAFRLLTHAEDYTVINFDEKKTWLTRVNQRFRSVPLPVKVLAVNWVTYRDAAVNLVGRYVDNEWALHHKLGMVTKRGQTEQMTIKDYVKEVLPEMASEQEWVQI